MEKKNRNERNKLQETKGITMVSLAIVVTVILILTGVLIYNVRDSLGISNLKAMQNDIQNLRDMISNYYSINGKIPAKIKYTNTENIERIRNAGVISEKVDIGDFYIIDLKELENLTLNYGEDYKHIADTTTESEASQYTDIYIINETSQNIFYVEGIRVDEDWFYTDYTSEDVDEVSVNLRYIEGVKIPDGFYYVGGTKEEGIVISDNIEDLGKGTSHEVAQNLKGNQFVWVPVSKDNFDTKFIRKEGYAEGSLQSYLSDCGEANETGINDKFQESATTQQEAKEMYASVKRNGGFYIGRYESGKDNSGNVVVKKGVTVYNNVSWSKNNTMNEENEITGTEENPDGAIELARNFDTVNNYADVTSTLCYGVQWDAILTWIELEYKGAVQDSTGKGNYNEEANSNSWKGNVTLTGASEDYKLNNIYDLAGNVYEWTMESYDNVGRIRRGGSYNAIGNTYPVSNRDSRDLSFNLKTDGFRIALYLDLEENWSPTYDEEGTYKDKNGDTAYIPKGFQVSQVNGENEVDDGLVIRNATTDDRYVWIEVPKSIYKTAISETDYENIEKDMQNYTAEYKEGYEGYSDTWYSGCGISSEEEYNNLKNKMLTSVYNNGGFYISQYEIGADSYVTANDNGARLPVSKEGMYPYNYVTVAQAQQLATNMDSGEKTSGLMFGIQWDLVCKFLESKGTNPGDTVNTIVDAIKINSQDWGNTWLATFEVFKGKYYDISAKTGWIDVQDKYDKQNRILFSTGITQRNSMLNIYDFSGNVWEWTLEYSSGYDFNVPRGGSASSHLDHSTANNRVSDYQDWFYTSKGNIVYGFRTTIF